MFPHAVDRPSVHGVVHLQLLLRFPAQQPVDRQPRRLAQNVPLRDVERAQHARFRAAPGRVRDLVEEVLPQALDVGGVLAQDHVGVGLQHRYVRLMPGSGVRFTDAHNALVGVQPNPGPIGSDARNRPLLIEADGLDFGDFQRPHARCRRPCFRRPQSRPEHPQRCRARRAQEIPAVHGCVWPCQSHAGYDTPLPPCSATSRARMATADLFVGAGYAPVCSRVTRGWSGSSLLAAPCSRDGRPTAPCPTAAWARRNPCPAGGAL